MNNIKVLVTTDAHLMRTPDNKVWCETIYGYDFWLRYLDSFSEVRIAARLKEVKEKKDEWLRVDGKGIEIFPIPFYQGPIELSKKYLSIKRVVSNVFDDCDAVIYRLPSPTGQLIYDKKKSIPSAVELVFDPLAVSVTSFKEKMINKLIARDLKLICKQVNGVSYVTENTIQKNFPSHSYLNGNDENYFDSYYSSINLKEESYGKPISYKNKDVYTVVHSNVSMNSHRKGEIVLLEAISKVRAKGYKVKVVFIGDGSLKDSFKAKAKELSIEKYVKFTGLLSSSKEVRETLKKADIYVLPTKAEGLPRGIIEAMALGLPCISSPVGGIPELIEDKFLVDPHSITGYADKIIEMISNPSLMEKISEENIDKARAYSNDKLQLKRNDFYKKLINLVGS